MLPCGQKEFKQQRMVEWERQQDRLLIVTAGLHTGTLGGSHFNIRPQPGEALEASAPLQSMLTHPALYFSIILLCWPDRGWLCSFLFWSNGFPHVRTLILYVCMWTCMLMSTKVNTYDGILSEHGGKEECGQKTFKPICFICTNMEICYFKCSFSITNEE